LTCFENIGGVPVRLGGAGRNTPVEISNNMIYFKKNC